MIKAVMTNVRNAITLVGHGKKVLRWWAREKEMLAQTAKIKRSIKLLL
jgi:hypothetical protein